MSYPSEPLKEHTSAYFVQDRSNLEELSCLEIVELVSRSKKSIERASYE